MYEIHKKMADTCPSQLNPTGRWVPMYWQKLSLARLISDRPFYQSASDTAQQFHVDSESYLSRLPVDMFAHYFRQGYLFSLLTNCNRLAHTLGEDYETSMACVNAKYLVAIYNIDEYTKILYCYERTTLRILWDKKILKMGKCTECNVSDDEIMIKVESTVILLDMQGMIISTSLMSLSNCLYMRRNNNGGAVRITKNNRGIGVINIIQGDELNGEITPPHLDTFRLDVVLSSTDLKDHEWLINTVDINNCGNVCLTSNGKIYVFMINPEFFSERHDIHGIIGYNLKLDSTPYGDWIELPIVLTEPVVSINIDNDNNILVLQKNSISIYTASGSLVHTYERSLTSACIYDGVIYGCSVDGVLVLE